MINCMYKNVCSSYNKKCDDCINNKEQKIDFFKEKKICPICGNELIKYTSMVLTTCPPQYNYECTNCGYIEYGF